MHLNTRKEGPEDNQELALDLKFIGGCRPIASCASSTELLANFVFLSNGAVRNRDHGPDHLWA
ncbi:hypothetical protein ACU4GD_27835 [Cupriavidus basilensis]